MDHAQRRLSGHDDQRTPLLDGDISRSSDEVVGQPMRHRRGCRHAARRNYHSACGVRSARHRRRQLHRATVVERTGIRPPLDRGAERLFHLLFPNKPRRRRCGRDHGNTLGKQRFDRTGRDDRAARPGNPKYDRPAVFNAVGTWGPVHQTWTAQTVATRTVIETYALIRPNATSILDRSAGDTSRYL